MTTFKKYNIVHIEFRNFFIKQHNFHVVVPIKPYFCLLTPFKLYLHSTDSTTLIKELGHPSEFCCHLSVCLQYYFCQKAKAYQR